MILHHNYTYSGGGLEYEIRNLYYRVSFAVRNAKPVICQSFRKAA